TSVREFLYKDNGKKYLLCNLVSYSVSAPLVLSSQPLLIVNNGNSWTLVPEFMLNDDHDPRLLNKQKIDDLRKHLNVAEARLHGRLLEKSVDGTSLLRKPLTVRDRPQIIAFYKGYVEKLAEQKLVDAVGFMAYTSKEPKYLLSTVGADAKRWKSLTSRSELHTVLLGKEIAFIVLKESYLDNTSVDFIACPVVASSKHGHRLLPHYFRYEHGRGEQIANQNMLKDMEKALGGVVHKNYLELAKSFTQMVNQELKQDDYNDGK
ncbi:MAG: hypothetical protein ABGY95_04435, partial [Rubritalea sp.]|uniref:hypothetical protein n=1 Tax=Rubritalea sp. TaxID=2109375 RepID=UPI0032428166